MICSNFSHTPTLECTDVGNSIPVEGREVGRSGWELSLNYRLLPVPCSIRFPCTLSSHPLLPISLPSTGMLFPTSVHSKVGVCSMVAEVVRCLDGEGKEIRKPED